ncbi:hypothetical protein HJC99_03485 [Candidatus Saccharibacteria bacterium]|nr:hypothetical protein [Candidatus Saccharibacteria bacterium]
MSTTVDLSPEAKTLIEAAGAKIWQGAIGRNVPNVPLWQLASLFQSGETVGPSIIDLLAQATERATDGHWTVRLLHRRNFARRGPEGSVYVARCFASEPVDADGWLVEASPQMGLYIIAPAVNGVMTSERAMYHDVQASLRDPEAHERRLKQKFEAQAAIEAKLRELVNDARELATSAEDASAEAREDAGYHLGSDGPVTLEGAVAAFIALGYPDVL